MWQKPDCGRGLAVVWEEPDCRRSLTVGQQTAWDRIIHPSTTLQKSQLSGVRGFAL